MQAWPAPHALAQAPQLTLSVPRLTQRPEQLVSPLWHETAHVPAEQTPPDLQAAPQVPQL